MEERPNRMDSAVAELADKLARLEERVARLEARLASGTRSAPVSAPGEQPIEKQSIAELLAPEIPGRAALTGALSAAGRTFVVFGGAYLLRALTDAGAVPAAGGIALGLAYGVLWLGFADRAGGRGGTQSAAFHAVASVLIVNPLLWEATTRFAALTPVAAATLTFLFTALAQFVAWRRGLGFVAWVFTLGGVATGIALLIATRASVPFTAVLLLIGGVSVWLGHLRPWPGIRWIPAIVADLAVLTLYSPVESSPPQSIAFALTLGLLAVFLGSFAVQTLVRQRDVGVFEVLQSLAALVVGLGGAASVAHFHGSDGLFLGWAAWIAGGACYAVAFAFVRSHLGRGRNFFFYTSLAIVLILFGGRLTERQDLATWIWIVVAIGAAVLGGRFDRVTLRAHSAILLAAAAWKGGLLTLAATAFLAPVEPRWPALAPLALLVLLASVISYAALVATRRFREAPRLARIPRFVIALLSVLGLGSVAVFLAARALAGDTGVGDRAQIAAVRTAVLAGSAIALAAVRARSGWKELTWTVALLLAAGGGKLLFEDLRSGNPVTLFVAFASYGIALLVAARLLRSNRETPP